MQANRIRPPACRFEADASARVSRLLCGALVLALVSSSTPGTPAPGGSSESSESAAEAEIQSSFAAEIANLRRFYIDHHRLTEAEIEGKRLLAAIDTGIGCDTPEAIEVSGLLVGTLMQISKKRVPEAVAFAERALGSAERIYLPTDLRLIKPLNDLGGALGYLGSFEESRVYHERALRIQEAALGRDHPSLVDTLGKLASSQSQLGDYAAERLLHERSLEILERKKGQGDTGLAFVLSDLAVTSRQVGDLQTALAFAERSVRILERAPVAERGQLGRLLATQANILYVMGRFEESRDVWERAIRLWIDGLGREDGNVAWGLSAQALTLSGLGEHESARSQAERAYQIQSRAVDPDDRTLVLFLRNQATVLINAGDDTLAEPLLERALRLRELAYGHTHSSLAQLLDTLSRVKYRLGRSSEAVQHALRGESIARGEFTSTARILSERQVYQFERSRASSLQVALTALGRGGAGSASVEQAWDELVRSRALVLDELASRHRAATLSEGPEVAALVHELRMAKSRLASLVIGSAGDSADDAIAQAQARKERIEGELSRGSAEYRRQVAEREVGLASVRSALSQGTALLAYVEYARLPVPVNGPQRATDAMTESHYGAFVLTSSSREAIFFTLGPAREIDPLIQRWRERAGEVPSSLEPLLGPLEEAFRGDGRFLRERIWDPLVPALGGTRTLFVVPDGALQLVSLATLPTGRDRYLVETGPLLHYLSAERDLVHHSRREYAGAGALIIGGVDLDAGSSVARAGMDPGVRPPASATESVAARPRTHRSAPPGCGDFHSLRFEPLSGAGAEVSELGALIKKQTAAVELTGAGATEAAFKAMAPGRRLLHVATHGFFLDGRCPSALAAARTRGGAGGWPHQAPEQIIGDNPLLLSGLVLAGANRRGDVRGAADGEDGILTAEEIGSLDLSGIQWAVLSACETGVGKVEAGEGVLGLRRAFAVAGAGSLIMSLWRVDDEATREWMGKLYRNRLLGLATAESVREASLAMIRERRATGQTAHPFFWGAFVAEGDWR